MCTTPFIKKHSKDGETLLYSPVPCGKCNLCKKRRINDWLFRMEQEMKISSHPLFITLTYKTEHLTLTNDDYGTLVKSDLQNFIKRLRHHSKNKLVYFACGEYGKGITKRPHYHVILLNFELSNYSETIEKIWNKGRIDAQPIKSMSSVAYTLKYINKQNGTKTKTPDKLPEFALMSKGIGKNYLSPSIVEYHNRTPELCFVRRADGRKLSIPKYYKEKIYNEEMRANVTTYNSVRAKKAENIEIANYMRLFPQFSRNEAIEKIRANKNNFVEKRNNESI